MQKQLDILVLSQLQESAQLSGQDDALTVALAKAYQNTHDTLQSSPNSRKHKHKPSVYGSLSNVSSLAHTLKRKSTFTAMSPSREEKMNRLDNEHISITEDDDDELDEREVSTDPHHSLSSNNFFSLSFSLSLSHLLLYLSLINMM